MPGHPRQEAMIVITVARKPLSEPNVALNVLAHGTGALNLDATRVGSDTVSTPSRGINTAFPKMVGHQKVEDYGAMTPQDGIDRTPRQGRWPANTILQHLSGCQCLGSHEVVSTCGKIGANVQRNVDTGLQGIYGKYKAVGKIQCYVNPDGTETVPHWSCVEGCPVLDLDKDSPPNVGGPSRYFKQV